MSAVIERGRDGVRLMNQDDLDAIMAYDVMSTPALVIDEEVKSFGRIPRKEEIAKWIQAAL